MSFIPGPPIQGVLAPALQASATQPSPWTLGLSLSWDQVSTTIFSCFSHAFLARAS